MAAKLMSGEALAITSGIAQVLGKFLLRVVASDATSTQQVMKVPAGHLSQPPSTADRENTPAVESDGQLSAKLLFDLAWWDPQGRDDLIRNLELES